MNVGSLFSGIGGFDLGLERAGMRTVWFCEQDPYCQRVLAKHWPGVPCFEDVRAVGAQGTPAVDVLAGGFPCQPVSQNGRKLAQADERWLWPEFARVIGELRPRYVLVENVAGPEAIRATPGSPAPRLSATPSSPRSQSGSVSA